MQFAADFSGATVYALGCVKTSQKSQDEADLQWRRDDPLRRLLTRSRTQHSIERWVLLYYLCCLYCRWQPQKWILFSPTPLLLSHLLKNSFFSFFLLLLFPPSFKILSQALVLPPFCLYSLSPTIHNAGPLWVITGHFSKRYRCHVAAVYWYIYAHGLCQRNNSEPMRSVWLIDCLWLLWIWFKQQEWNDQYNSRDPPLRELLWTTLLGFCPTLKLLPRSYIFGQLCLNGSIWQD